MSQLIYSQFDVTHQGLMGEIKDLDKETMDKQPKGFNNNIHWHIGHILTVNEAFLFGFPDNTEQLPERYNNLFGNGTKPADWSGDVPSVAELKDQLADQLERIKQIPEEKLAEKLPQAILGAETFGELMTVAAFHEANHAGRINAQKKALKN